MKQTIYTAPESANESGCITALEPIWGRLNFRLYRKDSVET